MHVGVVGGGLTGLATLHELRAHGIEATVFEAAPEVGGVVKSEEVGGVVLERGPQRMRLSPIIDEYLDTFDLRGELRTAPGDLPIYIYRGGRLREVPFDVRTGLRTDLLSPRGKCRLLLEPLIAGARKNETAAEYFSRKLGREAYRYVIEPLFGGLYASDPAEMPAKCALEPLIELEREQGSLLRLAFRHLRSERGRPPAVVPEAGMQSLPERIATRYRDRVRLDDPVESIERVEAKFRIRTDSTAETVDIVVMTAPAPTAGTLLRPVDRTVADRLVSLRYNPLALVYIRGPIDRPGLGYQLARDGAYRTLGVSWNGRAFDRDDLNTVFLGGMRDADLVRSDDDELVRIAVDEFEAVMGVTPEPIDVHRVVPGLPAYDRTWRSVEDLEAPAGIVLAGNYTSRVGIPGRLRQGRRIADRLQDTQPADH